MSLTLPRPSARYEQSNEAQARRAIELNDIDLMRVSQDVDIAKRRLILQSPDGALWSVLVSNAGVLSTVAL